MAQIKQGQGSRQKEIRLILFELRQVIGFGIDLLLLTNLSQPIGELSY